MSDIKTEKLFVIISLCLFAIIISLSYFNYDSIISKMNDFIVNESNDINVNESEDINVNELDDVITFENILILYISLVPVFLVKGFIKQ